MRKVLMEIVALSILLSFTGCSDNDSTSEKKESSGVSVSAIDSDKNNDFDSSESVDDNNEDSNDDKQAYTIKYDTDYDKLDDNMVHDIVDAAINQAKAVVEDDHSDFKSSVNIKFMSEFLGEDESETEDDLKLEFERLKEKIDLVSLSDLNEDVTEVKYTSENGGITMTICLGDVHDAGTSIGVTGVFKDDKYCVVISDVRRGALESEYDEYNDDYADDYSNAKLAYNIIYNVLSDMEIEGKKCDLGYFEYMVSAKPNDDIQMAIYNEFDYGYVCYQISAINEYDYRIDFVQYKPSIDSDIVEQYPDPDM